MPKEQDQNKYQEKISRAIELLRETQTRAKEKAKQTVMFILMVNELLLKLTPIPLAAIQRTPTKKV